MKSKKICWKNLQPKSVKGEWNFDDGEIVNIEAKNVEEKEEIECNYRVAWFEHGGKEWK